MSALWSIWRALSAIVSVTLACAAGILPRRHWPRLDAWAPVSHLAAASGLATILAGASIGIPGFFNHAQANADAAAGFVAQALGVRRAPGVTTRQAEGMAVTARAASYLSMMTFVMTPAGAFSLYLMATGAFRAGSWYVEDPRGDPILTAIDTLLLKRRTEAAARRSRAGREELEGPDVPDRLITGKAAGIPEAEFVVVSSRRKAGWEAGVFVITPDSWYRLGMPVERMLHAGLRTLYPLTELRDLEVRRKSVEYELPALSVGRALEARGPDKAPPHDRRRERKDRAVKRVLMSWCLSLAVTSPAFAQGARPDADPRIATIVGSVSQERIQQLVERLASFGTRHTLSDTTSTARGIGAARQWISDELKRSSPRLQVSFDSHKVAQQGRITRDAELRNVVAILPGRSSRRVYVTAHYDTVSIPGGQNTSVTRPAGQTVADPQLRADQDYDIDAPGANDNGSGTALTMELARVLAASGLEFDATLVFALWAGEEQGLIGSRAHAQRLAAEKVVVDAVLNNDIVGNSRGGNGIVDAESVRVYSNGPEDSTSRSLARYVERVAALYVPAHRVRLIAREDRFGRGSDHSSFNAFDFPAVVFREANENFDKQHAATDTVDGVDSAYLALNTRVNAAVAASLALAPPAPRVANERGQPSIGRQPSGYDANLRWNASPGAVAYRVYWRDAWANDWQHNQLVGNVTEFVLPNLLIDDFVFGVSAVGPEGHESVVSAYVSPQRSSSDVKLIP